MRFRGRVQVDDRGDYWVVILGEGTHGTRERKLHHRDCQNASDAAALIIALAIDPALTLRARERQQQAFGETKTESPHPPRLVRDTGREERRLSPSDSKTHGLGSLQADVGFRTGFGMLPGIGLGIGFELGFLLPASIRIAAAGTRWGSTQSDVPERADAYVKFDAWSLGLRVCWLRGPEARWAFGPCAGFDGSRMSGTGFNLDSSRRATDWWWGALAGVRGEYRIAPRSNVSPSLMLVVEGGRAIDRPRFGLADGNLVYQPAPWFVQSNLGISVSF